MSENNDARRTKIGKVTLMFRATPATLLVPILTLLLGCAQKVAVRERSDLVAGSRAAKLIFDGRRKVFTDFTPLSDPAGACASRNGKLVLYPDGSWEWETETMSSNGRNRWQQTFHFYDSEKPDHTWYGSREGGSWDLYQGNIWTYWRYGRGAADLQLAQTFDRIGYVVWVGGC